MKLLKELFQRRTTLWIALELILVTLALWWTFDPVLVDQTVFHLPMGYDVDRLVKFQTANTFTKNEQYQQSGVIFDEQNILLQKVEEMDEVEVAYIAENTPLGFESQSLGSYFSNGNDSVMAWQYHFTPDSKMFEVYGIESLTPDVPTSELTHDCHDQQSVIITRSLAMALYGTIDLAGRTLKAQKLEWVENEEGDGGDLRWVGCDYNIRAVVKNVRIEPYDCNNPVVFLCESGSKTNAPIIARLREGVDATWFMETHNQEVQSQLVTEHQYVRDILSARQSGNETIERIGGGRRTRRNLLIAAFFAINLCFGVVGTLLMYTRQRREEAGVRRAYGATRLNVFWGFIREAWLLTTISVIAGCIIYFQFAKAHGLYEDYMTHNPLVRLWFNDFATHFMVVSLFVYLAILCVVLIATAIPAWRICRSEITEALKDE